MTHRRLIATALAASALLLAACGGGSDGETPTPAASTQPATTPATGSPGGATSAAERTIDLAHDTPLVRIDGADTGDYFNDMPALVTGDVNGDGLADLLIGARFADGPDNSREDAGEAYIILGKKTLPSTVDLAVPEADVTIYGATGKGPQSQQGDQAGFSAVLADFNGDGIDDILTGAPFFQRRDTNAASGAAYVIFGRKGISGVFDLATKQPDVTLLGMSTNAFFGDSVTASDLNGDGVADVVVGSPFAPRPADLERPGQQAGAAYVFFGGSGLKGEKDLAKGQFDLVVYGKEEFEGGDEAGDNVAGGDLNNDGIGDIAITGEAADGPNNDRSVGAEVYVIYGSKSIGGVKDIGRNDQDVILYGKDVNDTFGFNIGIADVTGDGIDDLLASARGGDGEGNRIPEAGELHIFPGPDLPETIDLADYPDDIYLYGADPADFLGNALGAVDIDGDGVNELFVGVPAGDGLANDPFVFRDGGEAFVLDARGLRGGVDVLTAPIKLAIYGAQPDDALGTSMTAGDMNGDGKPEIVVLAVRSDGPGGSRPDAGTVYILAP